MINGFEGLNKFQSYIGKEIWIYIPGVGPDMYNGTIDCRDPKINKVTIEKIVIKIRSIEIFVSTMYGSMMECTLDQCFLTKEEAETYMQKQIDDGTAWL